MSFEEDVRKQIAKKRDEEAARKAQKEQLEAEKIRKKIEQANNCAFTFYDKCIETAAGGMRSLTMYVVEVKEMYCDSRIGLITEKQEKEAIASHVRQYIDYSIHGDYESMLRWAEALPKTFALNTANEMEKALRQKGLTNVNTKLHPVYKWITHPPSFFHTFGRIEKTKEVIGYYLQITASW